MNLHLALLYEDINRRRFIMLKRMVGIFFLLCMLTSVMPVFASTNTVVVIEDVSTGKTETGGCYIDVTLDKPVNGVLGVAFYENKVMTEFKTMRIDINTEFPVHIDVPSSDCEKAKVFIWDNLGTAKPLGDPKDVTFETSNLKIMHAGTIIENKEYDNIIIAPEVGNGEVTLESVIINGDLIILGGGSSSIKLDTCSVKGKITMAKETGEAPRLELTNTPITAVEVQKPAIIEAADNASAVTKIEATANIEIKGENTKIDTLAIPETADNAVAVTVTAGSVATVEAKAETSVTGASNSVDTIIATAAVTADSEAVQKVEIPESATESVSVTVTGDASVDVEINSTSGAAVTGTNVTVSTTLETAPDNITVGGEAVTHIHKWGEPEIIPATCEQEGRKIYTCTADGCTDPVMTKKESIPALGHNYGDWKQADNDLHVRECANDKDHYEKQVHKWDDGIITTEPTETTDGVKTYTCSECKGTKTEVVPAIPEEEEPTSIYTFDEEKGLRIKWTEANLSEGQSYYVTIKEPSSQYNCTSASFPVGAFTSKDNIESGKISIKVDVGTGWKETSALYEEKEIANIIITDSVPTFTIEKDDSGIYKLVSDANGGLWVYQVYNKEGLLTYSGNAINGAIDSYANFESGCKVVARYMTWSFNDDKTFAEISLSGIATYTYNESTTSDVTITLVQDGDSIKATWTGTTAPNYYFEIEDSSGKYITSGWTNGDECYTADLSLYLPRADADSNYTLVVYSANENWIVVEEIARLDNCFEITVSGDAVEYDMAFNDGEDGVHKVTLTGDTLPSGIRLLDAWYDSLGKVRGSGSSSISKNKTNHQAIQNGYAYDLRVLTAYALDGQTIKATMTPPAKKTYVNENEPKIKWSDGGAIAWQAVANADDYKLNIYAGSIVDDAKLVATKNIGTYSTVYYIDSNFDLAELAENKDTVFTVELLALDANDNVIETVGILAEGINLTFTGAAPEFSFEVTGEKTYTITFAEGTPDGMRYVRWFDANNQLSGGKSGFGMTQLTHTYERAYAFAEGDTIKVYIATVDTITDTVWTITRTPDAVQTYTTEETDASLLSFRKWNTDIMFDGYDDVKDTKSLEVNGVKVVSRQTETMSVFLFNYDQTKGNITDADFVVELDGVEKERIKGNVDVTLSNKDVAFTINTDGTLSFDATTHGSFAYNITTKDGKTHHDGSRIAFNNGTLVPGWTLPTLTDGETINIMHIDCTYDETTKAISATISKHTSKTYTATNAKDIWFSEDGDGIYVEWKEAELATGEKYFITMREPESLFTRTKAKLDLGTFFDESDIVNGKLSIKVDKGTSWNDVENLYDEKEFANVTLTNTTPDFTIEKDSTGKYKFVSDLSGGAWVYTTYDGNGNLMYVGNVVNGAIDTYANFADGHTVKARYITWTLNNDKTFAEFTVSNIATYTYKESTSSDVKIALVQNGTSINATWTGANCDNGYTWALIEDGDIHQLDFVGKNVSSTADFKPCLTRIESGVHSYDFVLYEYDESAEDCIGKELGRLNNAIEVTITGEAVDYTMSFIASADGQYQITLDDVPNVGDTYLTNWNRNRSNYSSIYVSDGTQTYTETTFMGALQDGDIYDLRLLTTYTLDGQTLKAVMTPPSTKTYHSQPVYIVSSGNIGIVLRVVCPLPDAPFTMPSGATNLNGIVKTATLKWGDTEIITVNGNTIRYKDGLGYYFNINIGNGYDSKLEGMTLTFTPAENAGFEEFTVTNDTFVYSHTDSEEPMPQDGYTVRYSEADSKIFFENLDLKANYDLVYIDNSVGIYDGYTLPIDYDTEDRFCVRITDWAPWSQYDGRDFSLTKTTAIISGNSVTFETSKPVHPMNSGRYFGDVRAESPVVLNFDRGDGELKDGVFTCSTNDNATYEKMEIEFSTPDGEYWRSPGRISTSATKTASSFISSTFGAFAGNISDLSELYLLIVPENESDTKDYPLLLKIKRERGSDITADELKYSFAGNTDYYYELFAKTATGATSRLNPTVAKNGTVSGHINADMVNPAIYSWDGNFTKEDDGTYSITMTYQLLKLE